MEEEMNYTKIKLMAKMELKTGLHIGGSDAFAAIGATDSPVIKDPMTGRPYIPGSSIKGKMRTLMARALNRNSAKNPNKDDEPIRRLFGASDPVIPARLTFVDLYMSDAEDERLRKHGVDTLTEVKFENTIDRITAVAMPRQIERAVRGTKFNLEIYYEAYDRPEKDDRMKEITKEEVLEDISNIATGLELLQLDYLGGSGSRGYGRIGLEEIKASWEFPKDAKDESLLGEINKRLEEL
jgi:CRISPR-associated protein Csm3